MAIEFEYDAAIQALMDKGVSAWSFGPSNLMVEAGEQISVDLTPDILPMGIVELKSEAPLSDRGTNPTEGQSAQSITTIMPFNVWQIRRSTAGANETALSRAQIRLLKFAIMADRKLGGMASEVRFTGENWTGVGADWPVQIEQGIGLVACYLALDVKLIEV